VQVNQGGGDKQRGIGRAFSLEAMFHGFTQHKRVTVNLAV
jgi:hypothetical protein